MWECLQHPWIFPQIPTDILSRESNVIHMDNLRNYQARKRWKHSMKVVFLCNRLSRTKLSRSWQAMLEACHGGNTQEITFQRENNLLTSQPVSHKESIEVSENNVLSCSWSLDSILRETLHSPEPVPGSQCSVSHPESGTRDSGQSQQHRGNQELPGSIDLIPTVIT